MAATKQPKARGFRDRLQNFSLEQAYIVFAVIYLPCAVLFDNRGLLAGAMLALYTAIMVVVSLVLVAKFFIILARHANEHTGKYGSIFGRYILNMFIPLVMMKVYGVVVWDLWPHRDRGIICEMVEFMKMVMRLLDYQQNLTLLLTASFAVVGLFTLWSVRSKQ